MRLVKFLTYVLVFVATWVLTARLFGQTTFTASDVVAMGIAGIGGELGMRWAQRRKARKAAG